MTTKQIKYVRGLLRNKGLEEQKEALAWSHSDERTEHLSELTYEETKSLIKFLNGEDPQDQMIGKMLSIANEMGWQVAGKADVKRVSDWCEKYTPFKKPLKELDKTELPKALTLFEKVYDTFLKTL